MRRHIKNILLLAVVFCLAFSTMSCRQPSRLVVFPYEAKPRSAEALYGGDITPPPVQEASGKTNPRPGTYKFEQEVLKDN